MGNFSVAVSPQIFNGTTFGIFFPFCVDKIVKELEIANNVLFLQYQFQHE